MTPELPRAPISDPWLMAWQTVVMSASETLATPIFAAAWSISASTDSSVSAMFVPVSPSGTG